MTEVFGGGLLLADTSAWHRADHEAVRAPWAAAHRAGQIVTCSLVVLEILYSQRDAAALEEARRRLALLRSLPVPETVQRAAVGALRDLAGRGPLHHRVPITDVLIAAAAQAAGAAVLHYDHHYDRLAEVLEFDSRWITEPGSV